MPGVIDPETLHVDELPGIWAPVQWEQSEEDRVQEVETQAAASLLQTVDIPEAILRLLLNETEIEYLFGPPDGYNPDEQGEWDSNLITYAYTKPIQLVSATHKQDYLEVIYKFANFGTWKFEIRPEKVLIERI